MKKLVLYLHGKGGSAAESGHYKPLFPDCNVIGLDYHAASPWETGEEIRKAVETLCGSYDEITLIANSIGAFFSLHAGIDRLICRACYISPLVDMEQMILSLLRQTGATEDDLRQHGELPAPFGETLSWNELCYVRTHPVSWPRADEDFMRRQGYAGAVPDCPGVCRKDRRRGYCHGIRSALVPHAGGDALCGSMDSDTVAKRRIEEGPAAENSTAGQFFCFIRISEKQGEKDLSGKTARRGRGRLARTITTLCGIFCQSLLSGLCEIHIKASCR